VRITAPGGSQVTGSVRTVAPTVDTQTRNALVMWTCPPAPAWRRRRLQGRHVRPRRVRPGPVPRPDPAAPGRGHARRLQYVFLVGADNRVTQTKVEVGYRDAERVEILSGLKPDARVVASGAGFLNDGDLVQVGRQAPPRPPAERPP
jgi:multidrug efflux pump subunit AcrA (membrane-fusion protein)